MSIGSFISNVLKGIIAITMITGVVVAGVIIFLSVSQVSLGSSSSTKNAQPVMFTISAGENVNDIASNLQQQGIISNAWWFTTRLKLRGMSNQLKAGNFQVTPGMDTDKLIDVLSTSPVEKGLRFTVIEGTRLAEIAQKLSSEGIVSSTTFMQMASTPEGAAQFKDAFLAASGRSDNQGLEGYLFPDTYEIKQSGGDNSEAVIRVMLQTMEQKFTPQMLQTIKDRGLNVQQVLTVASIVQREGVVESELPTIAQVYWSRLDKNMLMNADPTIQYAIGNSTEWWPVLSLDDLKIDSPYNTYTQNGLPPSPICNPGLPAIQAAVYPAQTDYLYFTAKCDGTGQHAFSKTLAEQERNQQIYICR